MSVIVYSYKPTNGRQEMKYLIALKKHANLIPIIISIFSSVYFGVVNINDTIRSEFNGITEKFTHNAREPTYEFFQAQLKKQEEKIKKDPGDIKIVDIEFLYNQCNKDFGTKYLPTLSPMDRFTAKAICDDLAGLYKEKHEY